MPPWISDHLIINIDIELTTTSIEKEEFIVKRNNNLYSKEVFQNIMMNQLWNPNTKNANEIARNLVGGLIEALDHVCPKMQYKVNKRYPKNKWINKDIMKLMKIRDDEYIAAQISKTEELWSEYKQWRNLSSSS